MAELILLGSGASLNDGSREPTMLALRGPTSTILIDCGSNPVRQLQRLGIGLDSVERVVLTHSHPDHISGFGLLIEMLWLSGRRHPLPIHGPADAIDVTRRLFAQWDTSDWEGLPELQWREVVPEVGTLISTGPELELVAAPGVHSRPVIGIRARDRLGGGVIAYSADGEPSAGIWALAQGAGWLVHEATGRLPWHSSAEQATELARSAGVRRLVLVHLPAGADSLDVQSHAHHLGGQVLIGHDLDRFEF